MSKFVPCTTARSIGEGFFFRPIRSWHSGTFAGEQLHQYNNDGSGCIDENKMTTRPLSVTHRLYWHESNPEKTISAFLSYPQGMGAESEYFWEAYKINNDIDRFFGENAETEMEEAIKMQFRREL